MTEIFLKRWPLLISLTFVTLKAPAQQYCAKIFDSPNVELTTLLKKPRNYDRIDYLKAISTLAKDNASYEVYNAGGRMNLRLDSRGQIIRAEHGMNVQYHPKLEKVLAALVDYPNNFKELLADRGILNHADEFLSFLKKCKDCKSLDPWEVRQRASQAIGTMTVYRGIFITTQEARKIKNNGFVARPLDIYEAYKQKDLIRDFTRTYDAQINDHINNASNSAFISVSSYPEVSIAVADRYAQEIGGDGAIYLFRLEIPKLDLVHEAHHDQPGFLKEREETRELYGFTVVDKNNNRKTFAEGPDLESLVLFRILASEIKSIVKIKDADYHAATGY